KNLSLLLSLIDLLRSMPPSATFCAILLFTTLDKSSPTSQLSLEWLLPVSAGIRAPAGRASGVLSVLSALGNSFTSMHMQLPVHASLPFDLVLGRDWVFYCREMLPATSFTLLSGV
ncbi:hypothetical protein GGX14DRAFT_466783, partial [Mycena pura]